MCVSEETSQVFSSEEHSTAFTNIFTSNEEYHTTTTEEHYTTTTEEHYTTTTEEHHTTSSEEHHTEHHDIFTSEEYGTTCFSY